MRVKPAMEVEEMPDAASSPGSPCSPILTIRAFSGMTGAVSGAGTPKGQCVVRTLASEWYSSTRAVYRTTTVAQCSMKKPYT